MGIKSQFLQTAVLFYYETKSDQRISDRGGPQPQLRRMGDDLQGYHFNTQISTCRGRVNEL